MAMRTGFLGLMFVASILVTPPVLAQVCAVSDPAMLDLYLSGSDISQRLRRARVSRDAAEEPTLPAALDALNTHVWGLYWVSLYSRRLHEVLGELDPKQGPVSQYYSRWDATQLATSAALVLREVNTVRARLEPASLLPQEEDKALRTHLERVSTALRGCSAR